MLSSAEGPHAYVVGFRRRRRRWGPCDKTHARAHETLENDDVVPSQPLSSASMWRAFKFIRERHMGHA